MFVLLAVSALGAAARWRGGDRLFHHHGAGDQATADGSVLMSHSCDGDVMGLVYVMPAQTYPPGNAAAHVLECAATEDLRGVPGQPAQGIRSGGNAAGERDLSQPHPRGQPGEHDHRRPERAWREHRHRVSAHARGTGLRQRGRVGPNSNHWTTSLIANGLLRAKTAREAIRVIGSMIDEYGFLYYRAPGAGVALPIADDREVWLMEIFGPGEDWTPDSGRPGGVWCAQRIPDGEVGCSANRSRIGAVDLEDPDHFLASAQHLLAGGGTRFLEAGNAVRLARRLWRPRRPSQLAARMAGLEPGRSVAGT